jgi:Formate hydrogenlyase maturation protein HycH
MVATIAVYQLSHKFINKRDDVPENAKQVVYYALAVGHHVGVMDCFSTLFEIPLEEYEAWIESLPEGAGRTKLAGVLRWGEIEINRSHVDCLLPLLKDNDQKLSWAPMLIQCLRAMLDEPALYYMIRKYT